MLQKTKHDIKKNTKNEKSQQNRVFNHETNIIFVLRNQGSK